MRGSAAPSLRATEASHNARRIAGSVAPARRMALSVARIVETDGGPAIARAAAYTGSVSRDPPGALFEYRRPSFVARSVIGMPVDFRTSVTSTVPKSTTATLMAQRLYSFGE